MNDTPNTDDEHPIDAEFEPAPPPPPPETPARVKARGPGWLAYLVLFVIATAALGLSVVSTGLVPGVTLGSDEASPDIAALKEDQAALTDRVSALSQSIGSAHGTMQARLTDLEAAPSVAPSEQRSTAQIDQLAERVSQLENSPTPEVVDAERVAALERAIAATETDDNAVAEIARLQREINALRAEVERLKIDQTRAGEPDAELSSAVESANSRAGAAIALSAIEAASRSGASFQPAFDSLSASNRQNAALRDLSAIAATGAPTLNTLKVRFDALADEAAAATAKTTETQPGWIDSIFGDRVKVRRSDASGNELEPVETARVALARDDLNGAIDALANAPGPVKKVYAVWIKDARQRVSLDTSLEQLRLNLLVAEPE